MNIEVKDKINEQPYYTGDCTIGDCDELYDMKVMMQPCYRCNQNCWFCQEWDNNAKLWTKDDCDKVLEKLAQMPKDKKSIYFLFHGGEPTLCKYWEYFHYQLVDMWKDREVFIQTQTNLSINKHRLEEFLKEIHRIKPSHHVVDISSSYHIGKQKVEDFIEKMRICMPYVGFGPVAFSAELIHKEKETLDEYQKLVDAMPPGKIQYRPIIVNDPLNVFKSGDAGMGRQLPAREFNRYNELLNEDYDYYIGKDGGGAIETRYMLRYFPELQHFPMPFVFNCPANDLISNNRWRHLYITKCINSMIAITHSLNIQYDKDERIEDIIQDYYKTSLDTYRKQGAACVQNVKYMKCNSGRKGMEISHDMKVHHCHDATPFTPPDRNPITTVDEIDMSKWFEKDIMCMAAECICGQDWRWKEFKHMTRDIQHIRDQYNRNWFE